MFDLVLRGGRVLDGAGNPDFPADVAVTNGKIAAVGRLGNAEAREVLDVTGLTVVPGFIDVHSHSDALPFSDDPLPAKILQGVTTEVNGNCGQSPFPVLPENLDLLREHQGATFASLPWSWTRGAGYLDALEKVGMVSNVAPLVGHNAIRTAAMGFENRAPTPDELKLMQRLLAESLEDGAVGFSSGLIYAPGVYSETPELVALAEVLRGTGRPYCTHPRGETHNLFNALDEAIAIGEQNGISVQISHLKAAGKSNFGRGGEVIEVIEQARARGLDVTGDVYPYDAGSGSMVALLPPWCHEGGREELLKRVSDPTQQKRIERDIEAGIPGWVNLVEAAGWENIWISSLQNRTEYLGKSFWEIAEFTGTSPAEALCEVVKEERGNATMMLRMMDETDMSGFLAHPLVMIGSDAIITRGKPHPRTWGTYPRMIGRYGRDKGLYSMPEAIRKCTSYPAQRFGLWDRGLVRAGLAADLVALDLDTVIDTATDSDPEQAPIGMPHVVVNGTIVVRDGAYNGARAGQVLRAS